MRGGDAIAPGLWRWRWTVPHPEWEPGATAGSHEDWERDVGCVLCDAGEATVLIDPLGVGEVVHWLPEPRPLVPGDRLLGDGAGGLRLCPPSWAGR